MDTIEDSDNKLVEKLKKNPSIISLILLAIITYIGFTIRTKNLPLLTDVATGKLLPLALDPFVFLRYVNYIVENGSLMAVDTLRYYPLGYTSLEEFSVLSYMIAYSYKIVHIFVPSVTVEYIHVIYPAVAFAIGLVVFFFFMKKVFNWKIAIIASAFLAVIPPYLYRTMAGFSDKEAMAMVFMYLAMLFFVMMFKEKNLKKSLIYSVIGGISMGVMWLLWGGVKFLVVAVAIVIILMVLFEKVNKKVLYNYLAFLVTSILTLAVVFPDRAAPIVLVGSVTSGFLFLALLILGTHYLLFNLNYIQKIKFIQKLRENKKFQVPNSFITFGFVSVIGLVFLVIVMGPEYFGAKIYEVYFNLVSPFSSDRWALTVAESHQPYFTDWSSQFSMRFLVLAFIGAVILFYETFKKVGKKSYYLTGAFATFLFFFATSRYSSGAKVFNGESTLSIIAYLGSLVAFILICLYFVYHLYVKDKDAFNKLKSTNMSYVFVLVLCVFLLIGARSAIRLLFIFAPAVVILGSYGLYKLADYTTMLVKKQNLKYGVWLALIVIVFLLFSGFSQTVQGQASGTGPSYNQQWQVSMDWVQQNTPEDSVFAHWWDYGYWVQTGGQRATLSDGGNARGAINHFIGRYLLTGQSETEALELLAANEATHVLMISDEIGKYGAFSSIGADADYDRFSWIQAFQVDPAQSQETRDGINLVYSGGTVLDDDIIYQDTLFPAGSSAIGGFVLPTRTDELGNVLDFGQPQAALTLGGELYQVPIGCLFVDGKEITFEESEAIEGCLMVIPRYDNDQLESFGAAFWLSRDVYNTVFTKLYLFNEDWEYFDLVYSDEENVPLMLYFGRIVGPLKIWEVTYPDNLDIPEEYYGQEIPVEVTEIRK
jgi:asparagine N-glycosylation enzyme membrane subunit Stt3